MRLFIAIYPKSDELAAKIKDIDADIVKLDLPLQLMPSDQNHVTVAFLGEVQQEKLEPLCQKVREKISVLNSFTITTDEVVFGIGGNKLALKVERTEKLQQIRDIVIETANELGILVANEPYTPHISLTRASRFIPDDEKELFSKRVKGMKVISNFPVRSISIIKSELTHDSPKYTTLHDIPLNSY